ncbi:hypothetical protein [Polaromonas sp.]|uniref:hypothetical protein n=1 Tax=Polaromonas sp. TaxID=1869339 RepID=UPI00356A1F62
MTNPILSAQQRLAASRQAILRDMHCDGDPPGMTESGVDEVNADITETRSTGTSSGSLGLLRQVARSWWQAHPANLALDVAKPMMQEYAQAQPMKLLGIAAATGAALVVLRPWRLISLTGVGLALVKSTGVSGVVRSLLHGAGQHDRHR